MEHKGYFYRRIYRGNNMTLSARVLKCAVSKCVFPEYHSSGLRFQSQKCRHFYGQPVGIKWPWLIVYSISLTKIVDTDYMV